MVVLEIDIENVALVAMFELERSRQFPLTVMAKLPALSPPLLKSYRDPLPEIDAANLRISGNRLGRAFDQHTALDQDGDPLCNAKD